MFWKKIKSTEYNELLDKINLLSTRIAGLEIDLLLYVKKLKASKNLKKQEEETEDLNNNVLLTEHGVPASKIGINSRSKNR